MRHAAFTIVLSLAGALAVAQVSPEDHAAHHPDGAASAASPAAPAPGAQARPADGFERQMQTMQDMHRRLQAARTPAEKQALMPEQMKLMQAGMEMMSRMGPAGEGMGGMGGAAGMGAMMSMHGAMEQRMAMMEQMMQMMVDREAAMPRR